MKRKIFWLWNTVFLWKIPTCFHISDMEKIIFFFLMILQFHSFLIFVHLYFSNFSIYVSGSLMVTEANTQSSWTKERPNSPLGLPEELPYCKGYSEFSMHGINTAYFIKHPAFQTAVPQPFIIKAIVLYFKYRLCSLPQVIWDGINSQKSWFSAVC